MHNNNINNNNNNNNKKKFASEVSRTPEEMDAMFNNVTAGLELANRLGYKECVLCKTMSKKDSNCDTCGKLHTEYSKNVVLSTEEMMKGFDRICVWAEKKQRERN